MYVRIITKTGLKKLGKKFREFWRENISGLENVVGK